MYSTFHHVEPLETLLKYLAMCEKDSTQKIVGIKRVVQHAHGYEGGGDGRKWRCPHAGWPAHKEELEPHIDCMRACRAGFFDFHHLRAIGMTVDEREHNGYDDSDFYVLNFVPGATPEEDKLESVMYRTTRGWTYYNGFKIDMTSDSPWFERYVAVKARGEAAQICRYRLQEAQRVTVGKRIQVAKGRNFPIGLTGTVYKTGTGHYGDWALVNWDEPQEKQIVTSANVAVLDYEEPNFDEVFTGVVQRIRREWLEMEAHNRKVRKGA